MILNSKYSSLIIRSVLTAFLGIALVAGAMNTTNAMAPATKTAKATFVNPQGEEIGTATLEDFGKNVLIKLDVKGVSEGYHAIHIHETADCTPLMTGEDVSPFTNTGSHFNPMNNDHGMVQHKGPHAGDLPNVYANENGVVKAELINEMITLHDENDGDRASVFDEDGSAFIIHAGTDDYTSQPTGDAGGRVACAVIEK
ncbi:MAG: hypothetical protein CMP22_07925 [Rickettsiales bacterium]|nr:hypothetical protein [Rickettsiales bacterium]